MSQQNSLANGAKWLFFLAVVVLAGFLMLGTDLSKATWLSHPIAEAQAEQISSQTEIERKNAELDYEQRKFYAELERQKAQQQAAAQAAKDAETLAFQKKIHAAAIAGLWVIVSILAIGLFTASIFAGVGLNRYLTAKAQTRQIQPGNGRLIVKIEQLNRQVCALQDQNRALQSKVIELEQRENHRNQQAAIKNTRVEWPDKPDNRLKPSKPSSWAG